MPRPPLKDRARYPSGKAKPDNSDPVLRVKQLVEVAKRTMPIFDGPIGRLHLMKELTAQDVAAADYYVRRRARYDVVMGLPRRSAASPAYEAHRGAPGQIGSDQEISRARSQWEHLWTAMGGDVCAIMDRVCIELLEPSWGEKAALRVALGRVALYAGLAGGAKR